MVEQDVSVLVTSVRVVVEQVVFTDVDVLQEDVHVVLTLVEVEHVLVHVV